MGQKQSSIANWTMNDWAFGTGENMVPLEDVIDGAKELPNKYFGGDAIQNDASMNQMQNDLLAFDESLKKVFQRKKNKQSKKQKVPYQHGYQDGQQYYDQNQPHYQPNQQAHHHHQKQQNYQQNQYVIPEEAENHLPPIYADNKPQRSNRSSNAHASWICRYCKKENKSTSLHCRQCRQLASTS